MNEIRVEQSPSADTPRRSSRLKNEQVTPGKLPDELSRQRSESTRASVSVSSTGHSTRNSSLQPTGTGHAGVRERDVTHAGPTVVDCIVQREITEIKTVASGARHTFFDVRSFVLCLIVAFYGWHVSKFDVSSNCSMAMPFTCVCPAGYARAENGVACEPCRVGTYREAFWSPVACKMCPVDASCSYEGMTEPHKCAAGTKSEGGGAACIPCPAGTYHSISKKTGVSSCRTCPQGHECLNIGMTAAVPCLPGMHAPGGAAKCRACAIGTHLRNTTSVHIQPPCRRCPPQTQCLREAMEQPDPCPPGSVGMGGDAPCTLCAPGTYRRADSPPEQLTCTRCPPHSECPRDGMVEPDFCREGTDSGGGAERCHSCPAGTFRKDTRGACTPCPPDTECTKKGTVIPVPCPPGSTGAGANAKCEKCPIGDFQTIPIGGGPRVCVTCPSNTECLSEGTYKPTPCPRGSVSRHGQQCRPCPGDTLANTDGVCEPCPEGSWSADASSTRCKCRPGHYLAMGQCVMCNSGTYKDADDDRPCTPCPAETTSREGSTSKQYCHSVAPMSKLRRSFDSESSTSHDAINTAALYNNDECPFKTKTQLVAYMQASSLYKEWRVHAVSSKGDDCVEARTRRDLLLRKFHPDTLSQAYPDCNPLLAVDVIEIIAVLSAEDDVRCQRKTTS